MMSYQDYLIEQGIEKGKKQGREEQIYKTYINLNKDVDMVLRAFDITKKDLDNIILKYS